MGRQSAALFGGGPLANVPSGVSLQPPESQSWAPPCSSGKDRLQVTPCSPAGSVGLEGNAKANRAHPGDTENGYLCPPCLHRTAVAADPWLASCLSARVA